MRILLLCSTFNSLSQRLFVELREAGHELAVEIDAHEELLHASIDRFGPELILAPFLRRAIPDNVLDRVRCLVVHPGPPGDGGPDALGHAILDRAAEWGVTVLEATPALDAGPVHAFRLFPMREATKSDLYANEVTEGAVAAVFEAIEGIATGRAPGHAPALRWRGAVPDEARAIDVERDDVATILRKAASGDGAPGATAQIAGRTLHVFDLHREERLAGRPGRILAACENAVCVAVRDGAVWIGHARRPRGDGAERPFKQAATSLLAEALRDAPRLAMADPFLTPGYATLQDIAYREEGEVGVLSFDFYNGGMNAAQARRLAWALDRAAERPTRVLMLAGGRRFWSTGMDLMAIEAAESAADESWAAINAIDDVVLRLIGMTGKVTIAALAGNAGAGGAFMALACDHVWAREGIVLNPHYKNMGNLYGSEYWTYLLPRRVGASEARELHAGRLPVGAGEAHRAGFLDAVGPASRAEFAAWSLSRAKARASDPALAARLADKAEARARDEAHKPLAAYRAEELARMREAFYGFDPSYHVARYNFIAKAPQSRTPRHLQGRALIAAE